MLKYIYIYARFENTSAKKKKKHAEIYCDIAIFFIAHR